MSRPMKRKLVSSAALCCAGVVVGAVLFPVRTGAAEKSPKPWASKVVSWNEAKGPTADWGEIRLHFQGETFATKDMLTGIAVVKPGQALHGAHRHAEEEYLVQCHSKTCGFLVQFTDSSMVLTSSHRIMEDHHGYSEQEVHHPAERG